MFRKFWIAPSTVSFPKAIPTIFPSSICQNTSSFRVWKWGTNLHQSREAEWWKSNSLDNLSIPYFVFKILAHKESLDRTFYASLPCMQKSVSFNDLIPRPSWWIGKHIVFHESQCGFSLFWLHKNHFIIPSIRAINELGISIYDMICTDKLTKKGRITVIFPPNDRNVVFQPWSLNDNLPII